MPGGTIQAGNSAPGPRPEHRLLEQDEPPPAELVNASGRASTVLVCDHASHRIPRKLGTLGLDETRLRDHIGWDPGAARVARRLSALLDAPLLLSGYSRLVIDCNRPLASPQSIAEHSDGVSVPGNQGLSADQRDIRVDSLFRSYHDAISHLLDSRAHRPTLLLSIHSFTPILNGQSRPWHLGLSYWKDPGLAALLRGALSMDQNLCIGDNAPYAIEDAFDYTIPVHGEGRGLPSVMIEIRQDGVRTCAQAAAWATRIERCYRLIEPQALRLT